MKHMRVQKIILTMSMLVVLSLSAGCWGTSAAFHYDRDTVWKAAVGQSIIWRPNVIDDEKYEVSAVKQDPAGNEIKYQLRVRPDPNPFAARPSTRVYVYVRQTKPRYVRFKYLEREFLSRLAEELRSTELNPLQRR